jgi:hypothetical protein
MLARDVKVNNVVQGCELIAYPCDANGRVRSWCYRYVTHSLNFQMAAQKLRLQIINGMATLHLVENL